MFTSSSKIRILDVVPTCALKNFTRMLKYLLVFLCIILTVYTCVDFNNVTGYVGYEESPLKSINTSVDIIDGIEVHIKRNIIQKLCNNDFVNLSKLEILTLSGNKITTIEPESFKHLLKLKTINLNENNIQDIISGTFNDLPEIEELSLYLNKFIQIKRGLFNRLPLKMLSLGFNRISTIEEGAFGNMASLETINLGEKNVKFVLIFITSTFLLLKYLKIFC